MFTKWGVAAALAAAGIGFAAAQPTFPSLPSLPPDAPTIDFPLPEPGPPVETGKPPTIVPVPPSDPGNRPVRPPGVGQPVLPRSVNVQLKVERDGSLTVREQVVVQAGQTMTRTVPLRIGERLFAVRDAEVDGEGTARVEGSAFVMSLREGASTVTYTVDGAIADLGDRLRFHWQVAGGWDTRLVFLRASLLTPERGTDFVCLAGAEGTDERCDSALTDGGGVLRVVQSDLDTGTRVDLSADLRSGLVPANARFEPGATGATGPFAMSLPVGIALALVTLALLAGFAVVWRARARDAGALATDVAAVGLTETDGGRVRFASPDGVLPGQVGAVLGERVEARDLTATALDLAIRNYLWITDTGRDWQIVRRNPADDALAAHERAVYDALLPAGVDSVTASGLRVDPAALSGARSAVLTGLVTKGWLGRRPMSTVATASVIGGAAVLVAGATVLTAVADGPALLVLVLGIGVVALVVGRGLVPARTRRGSALAHQVRGVREHLRADETEVPAADREQIVSRSLPYALALGEGERWGRRLAAVDPAADGSPGTYWYAVQDRPEGDPDRFAARLGELVTALDESFARR